MSYELYVALHDSAVLRVEAASRAAVENVRSGYILARDAKQYGLWTQRTAASRTDGDGRGLAGAALERAVFGLAATHPEYVVIGEG